MNSQEDPEARIRDLERSLADVARTSELGTEQYPGSYGNTAPLPPPPPPPGYPPGYPPPPGYYNAPYTAPYPATPPRSSGGFSWWWLIVATFVIGGIAVGAGVAVFGANVFSSGSSIASSIRDRPDFSGGGGTLTGVPTGRPDSPGGKTQLPQAEPSVPPPGAVVTIGSIGENTTIACNDSTVTVSGIDNTIVITGHCLNLTVSGIDNVVTVDASDTIEASGSNNRITFKSGAPEINKSGFDNVVEQG
jgi:hypothetical protein